MGEVTQLLTVRDVARGLRVSARTVWRMVERGVFPQPIRYNRKLVRWKSYEVEQWINSQTTSPRK